MLTENREFNEIYEQYKNLILKAAYTYSGSYNAAEDITQDTFLKLYMGYDSMKKKNISSWLFTRARNLSIRTMTFMPSASVRSLSSLFLPACLISHRRHN